MFVEILFWGTFITLQLMMNRDALALNGSLYDKWQMVMRSLIKLIFAQGFRGITDIDIGPDGYLYFLTYFSDPAIYRIVPKGTPLHNECIH